VRHRDTAAPQPGDAGDHLDLAVGEAHLPLVVELDPHQREPEPVVLAHGREQRRPPLLEQLVVDGLVEMAELVDVAPAQGHPQPRAH
jgi:hypothetical protein